MNIKYYSLTGIFILTKIMQWDFLCWYNFLSLNQYLQKEIGPNSEKNRSLFDK